MRYVVYVWLAVLTLAAPGAAALDWIGAAGDGQWTYRVVEDVGSADVVLRANVRIDTPTTAHGPTHEGARFARYANNVRLGGYEGALILRRTAADDMLRVLFSSAWDEVLLWSSRGGILAVRPFDFEPGRTYAVAVTASGSRVAVAIDGQSVLTRHILTAPVTGTGLALACQEGRVSFMNVRAEPVRDRAPTPTVPPPFFTVREWKGQRWGFDGNEPLFVLGNDGNGCEVRLVRGYVPQLYVFWHWLNYGADRFYCNKLTDFTVTEQGGRLVFTVTCVDPERPADMVSRTTVAVTRAAGSATYLYDHVSELILPEGKPLRVIHPLEYTDPAFHNGVQSASTQGVQWPDPHPWSVYRHRSGALYKVPHNHALWYPGYGTNRWRLDLQAGQLAPNGGFWAMVGDPIANPVFTLIEDPARAGEFYAELCGWGYDLHMRWKPLGGYDQQLAPGTYTVRWRMSSVDGDRGRAWLEEATLLDLTEPDATWLLYTGGVGHVEHFGKVVNRATPFGEYPWGPGEWLDTTTGYDDRTSLRLEGPAMAGAAVGGSVFMEALDKDTDYEISCFVKTRNVRGEGPGIHFSNATYYPGVTGTTDWQRIGFVTRPTGPVHTEPFGLRNSGSGTVWFDNFQIRPLSTDRPATPELANAPRPLTAVGTPVPDVTARWTAASRVDDAAHTVLDLSGHGHHATLEGGAHWVDDGGTPAWAFDGKDALLLMPGNSSVDFGPVMTLSLWIKPGELQHDWNMIASGGRRDVHNWTVFLFYRKSPYSLDIRIGSQRFFTPAGVVPQDRWSHLVIAHDGQRLTAWVDGKVVVEGDLPGRWQPTGATTSDFRLGATMHESRPINGFVGLMRDCTIYARPPTAAELAP